MAKSSTALHGDTGVGKTALIGDFIKSQIKLDPDFTARLITGERWGTVSDLHKKGRLEVWEVTERENPFEALRLAVQGWWPENVNDPKSKIVPPSPADLQRIGLWAFEGGSTFSQYLKGSQVKGGLANRAARGERVGTADSKDGYTVNFTDGSVQVGGNSRSHYNIVQNELQALVNVSHRLPGHLIWTFHSRNTTKFEPVYVPGVVGPELAGSAATPYVQRWFDSLFNIRIVKPDLKKLDKEHRIYLKTHYDKMMPGIPHLAVVRLPLDVQAVLGDKIPEFLVSRPGVMSEVVTLVLSLQDEADKLIEKGAQ